MDEYSQSNQLDSKYKSWNIENEAMILDSDIWEIFVEVGNIFGFQDDNVSNMFDHFMTQLDSRASRMTCSKALLSLHMDYIGGTFSNYKKWYFSSQQKFDSDPSWNPKMKVKKKKKIQEEDGEFRWQMKYFNHSERDYILHIALYLLIWGEANNVRFIPECLCFIFQCALDHLGLRKDVQLAALPKFHFLNQIINPIYNFIRDQQFSFVDGVWKRKEIDHSKVIGYDDINQQFWSPEGLYRIKLQDGARLYDVPKQERYSQIAQIDWNNSLSKTYRERRTWVHVFTNFNRVWLIHVTMFWYFMAFNSPSLYTINYTPEKEPQLHIRLAVVAIGGTIAGLLSFFAAMSEYFFISRKIPHRQKVLYRLGILFLLICINTGPLVYLLGFLRWDRYSYHGDVVGSVLVAISIITFLYLALAPPGHFPGTSSNNSFSASFLKLKRRSRLFSYLLWICVFGAKYSESYFFLILSLKDPIQILSTIVLNCHRGNLLCIFQPKITLVLFYLTDLILFFLDTYLWYVICNCLFSVGLSFSLGVSIFTPWRNIFCRLPDRIMTKIYHPSPAGDPNSCLIIISQIWNSIIISMYREHFISVEQVSKLVYQRGVTEENTIRPPLFFAFEDDNTFQLHDFFTIGIECERRITFFAQSLSSPLPEPFPVVSIPAFTVLIPHYSEKILLSLKDLIKETKFSKLTLLDYLKQLHASEWDSFVKDSKMLQTIEVDDKEGTQLSLNLVFKSNTKEDTDRYIRDKIEDLPYYCVGFKDSSPEHTLRTRIWAALRCQTLYRTISGFMNYDTALKLLHRTENLGFYLEDQYQLEDELEEFVSRKFNLLVAMQKFQNFTPDVAEDARILFKAYPNLRVAILEEEDNKGEKEYYSTLLDVSQKDTNGKYVRKYRIKLSGNPILGDGKSDNQNNAIIFYRGEYIQVIDANQDNYLEECLKIKSLLCEFEEMKMDITSGYVPGGDAKPEKSPVAILGAREFIFSQNIGILGDIAAGKEQTFGTLFARTMGEIGSKLHYGHPDFLNGIFMTTRGGISKAQRGLHLNEDIYAGITAVCRGGRIKHCDYYQCGKGRDLGFESIINFTTKIGAGMGEQLLSREYFYLGTQLPIDRFLSFYYAHPGFHINNLSIMLSVKMFMLLLANLGALNYGTITCDPDDPGKTPGCHNLIPVLNWIDRFVLSVFVCFFISFLPLIIQELIEKGFIKAVFRIMFQVVSLSPLFEVFLCQIYSKALRDNLVFGEAQYIATGRGFAISRIPFATLYSRYVHSTIYYGCEIFLVIVFASLTIWRKALMWFAITIISLCLAPFVFNPHQFNFADFFLDYRQFIRWLSRGNSKPKILSWIHHTQRRRSKLTGEKLGKYVLGRNSSSFNLFIGEVVSPFASVVLYLLPYMFINRSSNYLELSLKNPILRLVLITLLPYLENAVTLLLLWPMSVLLGPIIGYFYKTIPAFIAGVAHFMAIAFNIANFEILFFLEGWNFVRLISASLVIFNLHRMISNFVLIIFVSRERGEDVTNKAWWSGNWIKSGLGFFVITQHVREFIVKILELNKFTLDFIVGHFLLFAMFPILFIPYIDTWHTSMLFWIKPTRQFFRPILSKRQRRRRNWTILRYFILFLLIFIIFVSLIIIPMILEKNSKDIVPFLKKLVGKVGGGGEEKV